jgi:hypothetical protein
MSPQPRPGSRCLRWLVAGSFAAALALPSVANGAASADNWNFPNDNYFRCVKLKNSSAPLHYNDFSAVDPRAGNPSYRVFNNQTYAGSYDLGKGYCHAGETRLDAHELLQTASGRVYLHKGGQGYTNTRTPYGHLWIGDLQAGVTPAMSGPPENGNIYGNGKGCTPPGVYNYRMHITRRGTSEEIPSTNPDLAWQYKPWQSSSRYNKYADAGPEQADGSQHYAYLTWSWLLKGDGRTTSGGGGMVRALIKEGQTFYRCNISAIYGLAWAPNSNKVVGRVVAIYGKTRSGPGAPWVYGWAIHSHAPYNAVTGKYEPNYYHLTTCPSTGCGG